MMAIPRDLKELNKKKYQVDFTATRCDDESGNRRSDWA